MPYPKRSQLPWTQLEASIQRALLWLHACTLLRRDDLLWVAWPGSVSRQWSHTALHGWADDAFIVPVDDGGAYGLGRTGAAKLRDAGIAAHCADGVPAPRVRPGIVLAGQFAVALARDLLPQMSIAHFTWLSRPFSGAGPRADGYGGVCYRLDQRSLRAAGTFDLLHLTLPDDAPVQGQALMWLLLEVDLGTETTEQLEQRAARWGMILRRQRSAMPPRCWPYVLWITSGGWDRAQTIWRAWISRAACPLFVTTVATLTIDGTLHPWYALWRDEHGRPRSLNPYAPHEHLWRFQASPPPAYPTLDQAIAAWEATQRA